LNDALDGHPNGLDRPRLQLESIQTLFLSALRLFPLFLAFPQLRQPSRAFDSLQTNGGGQSPQANVRPDSSVRRVQAWAPGDHEQAQA
jgi:hypothetical protein